MGGRGVTWWGRCCGILCISFIGFTSCWHMECGTNSYGKWHSYVYMYVYVFSICVQFQFTFSPRHIIELYMCQRQLHRLYILAIYIGKTESDMVAMSFSFKTCFFSFSFAFGFNRDMQKLFRFPVIWHFCRASFFCHSDVITT